MAAKKGGLGKGLGALIADTNEAISIHAAEMAREDAEAAEQYNTENKIVFIDINNIRPNANQPRKHFNDEKIEELANSIKEHGIIQPVVVRKRDRGYEIVAGERRWRAARKAELKELPCIIKELSDTQNMLLAIIENMQREDLNPIEEAEAINQMISTFGLTQEEVSKSVGKSRPYITNALRLLKLPEIIRDMVIDGKLSMGHARAIVGVEEEKKQIALAEKVTKQDLSVREIEKIINEEKPKGRAVPRKRQKNADIKTVEEELKSILGTKVELIHQGKKGKIEIEYYSKDELDRLIDLLKSLK